METTKCPSTQERVKIWHIYTMEYYSAIKKDEIMPSICSNMNGLRDCHTEWSEADRGEISQDIPYMQNLKRNDANELIFKVETNSQT